MASAFRNTTWVGPKNQSVLYDRPGTWNWPVGASAVTQKPTNNQQYGCDIHANGTTIRRLAVKGPWFRSFSFRNISGLTLEDCESDDAGVAGSGHNTGGQGLYGDHGRDLTLRRVKVLRPAGHGLYLAEVWDGAVIEDCVFLGQHEHSPLIQLNAGDVGPQGHILGVVFRRLQAHVTDNSTPCVNLLGAGRADNEILFDHPDIKGKFVVSNFAAPHPSFARVVGGVIDGDILVEGGSVLHLDRATRVTGRIIEKTGGKVIRG